MPPFRLTDTPSGATEDRRILKPSYTELVDHALGQGELLDDAARELVAPDRPVGEGPPIEAGSNPQGFDHPQTPVYPQTNPWPAVEKPTPFKNLK